MKPRLESRLVRLHEESQIAIDAIAEQVARQCLQKDGDRGLLIRIGNLELRNDERLKEPQLRHLWTLEVERVGGYTYALECPTYEA